VSSLESKQTAFASRPPGTQWRRPPAETSAVSEPGLPALRNPTQVKPGLRFQPSAAAAACIVLEVFFSVTRGASKQLRLDQQHPKSALRDNRTRYLEVPRCVTDRHAALWIEALRAGMT